MLIASKTIKQVVLCIIMLAFLVSCSAQPSPTPLSTPTPSTEFVGMKTETSCEYGGEFKSIEAVDKFTVKFTLCNPDPAFPSKVAINSFSIQSSDYLVKTNGTGELNTQPIGTGPYMLKSWTRGESITLVRNPNYWDTPANIETVIIKWNTDSAQRLLELKSGVADGIDNLAPDDYAMVENDPNLRIYPRQALVVFYIGMNNTTAPFNNEKVRQAIAMGIDRNRLIDNFYPKGTEVATHFTPCIVSGGCEGSAWYDFDVIEAKKLLTEAGFSDGFKTTLSYRNVVRSYLPDPNLVAQDIQAQLKNNLNIDVELNVMESGTYIDALDRGEISGLHMAGWGGDYPDQTNFLDIHFGAGSSPQFGNKFPDIVDNLKEAASLSDQAKRNKLYGTVNDLIRQHIPLIPVAHVGGATAFKSGITGAITSPMGNERFALMANGSNQIIFVQNAEPPGLYSADESDGEALRISEQIGETLLRFKMGTTELEPSLATSYTGTPDLREWVFKIREGVQFHDGTLLDANDVVLSFVVQWDAIHIYHKGRTGSFSYWSAVFGYFLNQPK